MKYCALAPHSTQHLQSQIVARRRWRWRRHRNAHGQHPQKHFIVNLLCEIKTNDLKCIFIHSKNLVYWLVCVAYIVVIRKYTYLFILQFFFKYNYKNMFSFLRKLKMYEKNCVYSYLCTQERIFKIYVVDTTFYIQQIIKILLHFPEFANILACCTSTCYILYADSQCGELNKCYKIWLQRKIRQINFF